MYKIILVPLDGSKRAESILSHVETLARSFKSKVVFFVAIEPVLMLEYNEIIGMSEFMEKNDYLKEKTASYLDSLQKKFSKKGIEVQTRIVHGPAVKAIVDAAELENANLVAMASHGRTGLSRTFYGSIAAGVLQRIDRPLLLIRSRGDE
ncbi:MAG: universal stress protein [Desulfobacterales bacterium]|jgi:nucleotide-binding universal stress UspA family protein